MNSFCCSHLFPLYPFVFLLVRSLSVEDLQTRKDCHSLSSKEHRPSASQPRFLLLIFLNLHSSPLVSVLALPFF